MCLFKTYIDTCTRQKQFFLSFTNAIIFVDVIFFLDVCFVKSVYRLRILCILNKYVTALACP